MKVMTLHAGELAERCGELRREVDVSGFMPDCVLAIANAGVYVARDMGYRNFLTVSSHRKSDKLKKGKARRLLACLPRRVADMLRMAEALWRESRIHADGDAGVLELPGKIVRKLMDMCPERILVVDDAVDTGKTLSGVVRALRALLPDAEVRSAAITVTMKAPCLTPDYYLYHDHTLIRFPWSADYNG